MAHSPGNGHSAQIPPGGAVSQPAPWDCPDARPVYPEPIDPVTYRLHRLCDGICSYGDPTCPFVTQSDEKGQSLPPAPGVEIYAE
jgi:hypothetical protein